MPDITIDMLRENIADFSIAGDTVAVTFHCPVSGRVTHAAAPLRPDPRSHHGAGSNSDLLSAARRGFTSVMRNVLGDSASRGATSLAPPDEGEVDAAIVEAFRGVADRFMWDADRKCYLDAATAHELVTGFDRQLTDYPIIKQWDRRVLARMLAEVAMADAQLKDEERAFFEGCLNDDVGSIEQLLEKSALNRIELEETTPGVRGTLLMLAFAIAMCDEELAPAELALLDKFAQMLGVSKDREDELRHLAAEKVIENMLSSCYAHDELTPEAMQRIAGIGSGIGVNQGVVAKIDVHLRKRRGI